MLNNLLVLHHRAGPTRLRRHCRFAMALLLGALLTRAALMYTTAAAWPALAAGFADLFVITYMGWACANAAHEAQEGDAYRRLMRFTTVSLLCWTGAFGAMFVAPSLQATNSSFMLALVATLMLAPFAVLFWAQLAMNAPPPRERVCRNCGYQCSGLNLLCPECGKHTEAPPDTAAPRTSTPTWTLLANVAVVAVVTSAAFFAKVDNKLEQFKPLWMLEREVNFHSDEFSHSHSLGFDRAETAAMTEIVARALAGQITGADARDLADRILDRQGDPKAPLYLWPEVFAILDGQGRLTREQHDRYVKQAEIWALRLPESIAEGERLSISLICTDRDHSEQRVPGSHLFRVVRHSMPFLSRLWIDDQPVPCPDRMWDRQGMGMGAVWSWTDKDSLPRIPAGTGLRKVRIEFRFERERDEDGKEEESEYHQTVETVINVIRGNAHPVRRETDRSVVAPLLDRWSWCYQKMDHGWRALVIQAPDDFPASSTTVIADLFYTTNDKPTKFGKLVLREGERQAKVYPTDRVPSGVDGFSLVVVPLPDEAEFITGATSVWAGLPMTVRAVCPDNPPPKSGDFGNPPRDGQ